MHKISSIVSSAPTMRALFFANAAIWLLFGVLTLIRMPGSQTGQIQTMALQVITALMLANACAMVVVGVGLARRQNIFYYLALAILAVNIVLTVTDQFGLFDAITLIFDLAILARLLVFRRQYLP